MAEKTNTRGRRFPTLTDRTRRKAIAHFREVDPAMAEVADRVGRIPMTRRVEGTHFDALVRAIVYQQISGKAAATIHARFEGLYGNRPPTPAEVLETEDAELRAAGLSRQKLSYLRDLAERIEAGEVPIAELDRLPDDEVIDALVRVKGVGRWSAQMFLMFRLGRVDVFPELDLGIQKGVQIVRALEAVPKPAEVARHGERWRPYRTVAALYLWRMQDGTG